MIRTRLLRSLARGKPIRSLAAPSSARSGQPHSANATTLYNSQLLTTVNHLHVNFGAELNKRVPRVVHSADDVGTASSSDPLTGKVDSWGLGDPQMFLQFSDRFPGEALYGLGAGDIVGVPNVMDVSQAFGLVHGEGSPGGTVYFRALDEQRGRFLQPSLSLVDREQGIPSVNAQHESVCSVWIAKSQALPSLSDGLIGILTGSSAGVLSAYSLGSDGLRTSRMTRGELTARWVLSPGVPIIAIAVDEQYSMSRRGQNRLWAVALNALGEAFYLTQLPRRPANTRSTKLDLPDVERLAWATGRSVHWRVVEPSRRTARPNPYGDSSVDGSYSPRSSWDGMCLAKEQIVAETVEIEAFIRLRPKQVQERCLGWDMQRRLEVDFAGDDGNLAGEGIAVFDCGLEEDAISGITRYIRCRFEEEPEELLESVATLRPANPSLFGGGELDPLEGGEVKPVSAEQTVGSDSPSSPPQRRTQEEWRSSKFSFGGIKSIQITTTSIDASSFATITQEEDPLLGTIGLSAASSPWASPTMSDQRSLGAADIPGQRARFIGIGTSTGIVILWNMRSSVPRSADLTNVVDPCRIIYTDSPSISCLAITALYAVHGGNDGLVQAWDTLASSSGPIRTLNSRFSSRARRRLMQAQARPEGVGINLFAAGVIALDPDPTSLRGVVSLGTQIKYWGFSSTAVDQYKSHKRRLRRSERGSNNAGTPLTGFGRGNIKDYIANERLEMEHERATRKREMDRLAGRFGTDMLGEDEAMAYAAMLSEETLVQDEVRRRESAASSVAATPRLHSSISYASTTTSRTPSPPTHDTNLEADIAEAIRQSLGGDESPSRSASVYESTAAAYSPPPSSAYSYDVPIRQAKPRRTPKHSPRQSPHFGSLNSESSKAQELSDLDFAMQLSLAEEQSRGDGEVVTGGRSASLGSNMEDVVGSKGKQRAL